MDGIVTVRLVDVDSGRPLALGVNAGGDLSLSSGVSPVRLGVTGMVNVTGPNRMYGYDGADWQRARLDASTFAMEAISYEHHEIHAGSSFAAEISSNDLDDEGVNDALHISFVTPDSPRWPHMVHLLYTSGEADCIVTEAPTGGVTGGSALPIYNRNRNSNTLSTLISTHSATVNQLTQDASAPTGGTRIHTEKMGAGKNKIGGESRDVNEWVLKQDTLYSFRMSSTVDAIRAQMALSWYEHVDKA